MTFHTRACWSMVLASAGLLLSCAKSESSKGTYARVTVMYDEAWGLTQLDVAIEGRTRKAPPAKELVVALPDSLGGQGADVEIFGMLGDEIFARGDTTLRVIKGETVAAGVTLERLVDDDGGVTTSDFPCALNSIETVEFEGGYHSSLAVGPDGTVWIAYEGVESPSLSVTSRPVGGSWNPELIGFGNEPGAGPRGPSLRVDATGTPWLTYFEADHDGNPWLAARRRDPESGWKVDSSLSYVFGCGLGSGRTSLAFDSSGNAFVAACAEWDGSDELAVGEVFGESDALYETVASSSISPRSPPALAIDVDGRLWVAYVDQPLDHVILATREPGPVDPGREWDSWEFGPGTDIAMATAPGGDLWMALTEWESAEDFDSPRLRVRHVADWREWEWLEAPLDTLGGSDIPGFDSAITVDVNGTAWLTFANYETGDVMLAAKRGEEPWTFLRLAEGPEHFGPGRSIAVDPRNSTVYVTFYDGWNGLLKMATLCK
jgi:hypothetical protein